MVREIIDALEYVLEDDKKKQNFDDFVKTLNWISSPRNLAIIHAIFLLRITTEYDLWKRVNIKTKDNVVHKLNHLLNMGLIELVSHKSEDYSKITRFWRQYHPNTNGKPRFFRPTKDLDLLFVRLKSLITDKSPLKNTDYMQKEGDFFKNFHFNQQEEEQNQVNGVTNELLKVVGQCPHCGEAVRNRHIENKSVLSIKGKYYHKECFDDMASLGLTVGMFND